MAKYEDDAGEAVVTAQIPNSAIVEPLIKINGLAKEYVSRDGSPVLALDETSISVSRGEFVCVVGPSGCGKSTLLRILAGILKASSGSVVLDGAPVTGSRPEVGIVFQSPVLLPWLTVRKNIVLPAQLQGLPKGLTNERTEELLKLVGLEGFGNKYPGELSGVIHQRVGIAL